jgi:putative ABC transport system ATP-binding protein
VAVARALINNPAIVFADEPTGALDSEAAEDIMDLLCTLNQERGQTVVMVTHALEVGERANRIIRMRDGRIEETGIAPSRIVTPPDEGWVHERVRTS